MEGAAHSGEDGVLKGTLPDRQWRIGGSASQYKVPDSCYTPPLGHCIAMLV